MRPSLLLLVLAFSRHARAETFPCDLSAAAAPPPILLVGENHCAPSSRAFKRRLAADAAAGAVYGGSEVALEHAFYPDRADDAFSELGAARTEASRFYGLESPFAHGLAVSYLAEGGPYTDCHNAGATGLMKRYAYYLRHNSYLAYAWEKAEGAHGGYAGTPQESMARWLDRAAAAAAGYEREVDRFTKFDFEAFYALERDINEQYVALANDRYLPELGFRLSLHPLRGGFVDGLLAAYSFDAVILEVRNRDMARAAMGLYCAAAKEGKPLVAVMGAAHVAGIEALLREAGGGVVPIRSLRSYPDAAAALGALDRLSASAGQAR